METFFVTELPYMCNYNRFYLGCIFVSEFNVINLHNNTHYKTFSKIMYNFQQSWLYRLFEEIVIEVLLLQVYLFQYICTGKAIFVGFRLLFFDLLLGQVCLKIDNSPFSSTSIFLAGSLIFFFYFTDN